MRIFSLSKLYLKLTTFQKVAYIQPLNNIYNPSLLKLLMPRLTINVDLEPEVSVG
jgi:hypothetical protein